MRQPQRQSGSDAKRRSRNITPLRFSVSARDRLGPSPARLALVVAGLLAVVASAFAQNDWPGMWIELEKATGDVRPGSIQYASGTFAVDWRTQGGTLAVDFDLAQPLPQALVYVRYARDTTDQSEGQLDLFLGPMSARTPHDDGVRAIGRLALPHIGHVSNWRWLKSVAGDLAAGPHRLFLSCPAGKTAGYLDLVGIVPGTARGLWQPPNDVLIGRFRDKPMMLPPWELEEVRGPTFANLLPAAAYTGPAAKPVTLTLRVQNNLVTEPLALTISGEVVSRTGARQDLPQRSVIITNQSLSFRVREESLISGPEDSRDSSQARNDNKLLVQQTGNERMVRPQPAPAAAGQIADIPYSFVWPGQDSGRVTLTVAGASLAATNSLDMAIVPFDPLWLPLTGRDGRPPRLERPSSFCVATFDLPRALPAALLYVNYSRDRHADSPGTLEIYRAPDTANAPTDFGAELVGRRPLVATGRETGPQDQWAVVAVGPLRPGHQRFFLALGKEAKPLTPPGERERFAATLFVRAGLAPNTDRGLWQPPITVALGRGKGTAVAPASLQPCAARIESVDCAEVGHLFLGREVLGDNARPLPFTLRVLNDVVTAPVACVVRGRLWGDHGLIASLPEVRRTLGPGERAQIEYPVRPPGYGWCDLELELVAEGESNTAHSAFGVLREAHAGTRPESMFGLAIGDTPADMQVAERIGVKWRRGIPHTNPADVLKKTGDPFTRKPGDMLTFWDDTDVAAVREGIHQWKSHGVLCLGYVNYNLPWNCLGGGAGGWHRNRPADMQIHTDMVYHLIKSLQDEVKYWEIWNEPWVGGWTWRTGTAQDYRDMCRMIWDRVKPEMPDVKLIGGGSTSYQRDVVFALNSPNAGYVDGVSTHPYGKPDLNHPAFAAIEAALLKKYAQGGGTGGIWATELGTAAYMFAPLPRRDADCMVARTVAPLYLLGKLGAGATPIHLFFFTSQYGPGDFSGGEHNLWDAANGTPAPRPALVAYSVMTHFLEDTKLLGDIFASSKSAWALHFLRNDGASIVVVIPERSPASEFNPTGTDDSERQQSTLRLPAGDFEVYDYLGRPIGQREGLNLQLPMQTWEARYLVSKRPPEQVRQAVLAARFDGLPALLVNPRSFDAPLPSHPALRVKVENLLPQTTDARLEVVPPKEITLATATAELKALQPGETRFVEFAVTAATPNAINRYPVRYRAEAGGIPQTGEQIVQVACATFGTPTIDGALADWADAIPVTMVSRGGADWREIAQNPDRAASLLAQQQSAETALYRVWTKWDARNFYVAAAIPDASLTRAEPYAGPISSVRNMPYMNDCLQLAFDCIDHNPDDLLTGQPLYEKSLAADVDYEFCAAQIANGHSELHRLKAPGTNDESYYPTNGQTAPPLGAMRASPEGGPDGQVAVRYDEQAQVLHYTIAIPWTCVGELGAKITALPPGQTLRTHFAFAVNDAGGRGRTFWTQEAGDLEAGSYGFSPTWGGGSRQLGGRIITDWGFYRPINPTAKPNP